MRGCAVLKLHHLGREHRVAEPFGLVVDYGADGALTGFFAEFECGLEEGGSPFHVDIALYVLTVYLDCLAHNDAFGLGRALAAIVQSAFGPTAKVTKNSLFIKFNVFVTLTCNALPILLLILQRLRLRREELPF